MMNCVIVLAFLATMVAYSESCSCLLQHAQQHFCQNDIVMQVRVKNSKRKSANLATPDDNSYEFGTMRYYNLKIHRIFKVKENEFGINKSLTAVTVKTQWYDSLCGVTLADNVKYVVTGRIDGGGEIVLDSCSSWIMPWPHVSKQMRKNLQFRYPQNCKCNIIDSNAERDPNACLWKQYRQDARCYSRHSACVEDINSTTGGCKWHRNKQLKKCRVESKKRWMP